MHPRWPRPLWASLFNSTKLAEKVQINWSRLSIPGLSHQVLQYQSMGNRALSGVEFYLDRFFATEQLGAPDIMEFRNLLRALTVPEEGFLKRLAGKEEFEFFVDNTGFHRHERRLDTVPVKVFTWYSDPDRGDIISINVESVLMRRAARLYLSPFTWKTALLFL